MSDSEVKIKLRKPIVIGSADPITEVTVRPVTGKDLRGLPENGLDRTLKLAGRLTGQSDVFVDKLEGEDLTEVLTVVQGFTARSP